MTTSPILPPPRWKQAWDRNPPAPGDSDWDTYLAALPGEYDRLQKVNKATPAAGPPEPKPYSNGHDHIEPDWAPPADVEPGEVTTDGILAHVEDDVRPRRHDDVHNQDGAILPAPNRPMAVAARMVQDRFSHSDGTPLVHRWRGTFWHWQTSHWNELDDAALRSDAYRYTEHATYEKRGPQGVTLEAWAPNRYKIADLFEAMKATTHLSGDLEMPAWLSVRDGPRSDPMYRADEFVACSNGLLHVPTRTLRAHDPTYFNRVSVPFPYAADAAAPVRWLAFLDELWPDDPEAIAALGEFFGYVISGRLDLHKIMLLIGPTRAGKGVIARILKALVGRGNYAGPTLASMATNFGLSPLIGKPLAIISDARLGGANVNQVVERLLSVSGEDMLTVDVKYREPWTGTLPTRFLVISNELPRFGDASGAIANRFLVLTLRESWLGREDHALTDALLVELPGILGWSLDGLTRLQRQGRFTEPASSDDAILALADLVSPASAFIRDRCVSGPGHEVSCDQLYDEWKSWAEDNGHKPGTVQTFGRNLRAVLPGLKTVRPRDGGTRDRWYQGVGLTTTHDGPDRGPSRTRPPSTPTDEAVVRDGPRSTPLSAVVDEALAESANDDTVPAS